jgi:hypothetical protein
MSFKKFFIVNLKVAIIGGVIGLFLFVVLYPISKKHKKDFIYHIYSNERGYPDDALYVKCKSNIEKLHSQKQGNILYTGKDLFFLNKNNNAFIKDTIENNIIKFKAIILAYDSSEVMIRGYTSIDNLHLQNYLTGKSPTRHRLH